MSKIDELIKEKCPNGVEHKFLYQITVWDKKFSGVTKDMQPLTVKFKHTSALTLKELVVDGGNIKLLSTGQFDGYTTYDKANDLVNEDEVITIPSGGTANIKYYNGKFVDSGNILGKTANNSLYNLKYIYYYLLNNNKLIESFFRGSGVKHPNMINILKIQIPIPPIEVQKEIVQILDKFGELETELEVLLEAELEVRKSQYDFWRGKLFDNNDVKYLKISEFANCCAGATPSTSKSEYWDNGTIPWMSSGEVNNIQIYGTEKKITKLGYNSSSTKMLPINTVVIALAGQGKTRGMVAITRTEVCTNQSLCGVIPDNRVDNEYLFYYLQSRYKDLRRISSGDGTRGGLNLKMIGDYIVPVPCLEKQRKIVNVLNKFSKIINSYMEVLPAEIEARKKQYEYYRNKLLSFEEVSCE